MVRVESYDEEMSFETVVAGAGIAGIATVGRLLDEGVDPSEIAWIDPEFAVGDLGAHWRNVPGNTPVSSLYKFLESSSSFDIDSIRDEWKITDLVQADPHQTCALEAFVDPLCQVTDNLRQKVGSLSGYVTRMSLEHENSMAITVAHGGRTSLIEAGRAVIATGCEPKELDDVPPIPKVDLRSVLNPELVAEQFVDGDVVAVYGSSHSAMLAIKNILEQCAGRNVAIVNFYRSELIYAYKEEGKTYHDNTGLKGIVAAWAKEYVDSDAYKRDGRLLRVPSNETMIARYAPLCTKAVHAVGLKRRELPIDGPYNPAAYNTATGEIVPARVWGAGSAFPELAMDPSGELEFRVGAGKFIEHIKDRIVPALVQVTRV